MMRPHVLACATAAVLALASTSFAQDLTAGMTKGTPDLKSAGQLAFAPQGVLLVGDAIGGAIFAIATGDTSGKPDEVKLDIPALDAKIAAALGTTPNEMLVNDLAVNPASGKIYLSISRGRGPGALPVLIRVEGAEKISEVPLKDVLFSKAVLPNLPAATEGKNNQRSEAITDLAYLDGRVFVAGLSNEEFASNLRSIPFPFTKAEAGTGIEIYHGSHGRFETKSPIRTFALYTSGKEPQVLAAYTCTPLVRFPVSELKPGAKVKGTTVAELGNRNRPLDMIVYQQGGKDFALLANNSRGVMKISLDHVEGAAGITEKISDKAGQPYETIESLKGVVQLARLNKDHAVVLIRTEAGAQDLRTIPLP
jgi:hypothetical protein